VLVFVFVFVFVLEFLVGREWDKIGDLCIKLFTFYLFVC
jgi:hypothetical protein